MVTYDLESIRERAEVLMGLPQAVA
jgi:hypothetical protein